ncbi:AAA family ATPase [Alteribacter natronophilus]|uniref:AAA family ATPase n=1 Tax=Alteribacter natronophilus TaxID=2583810 RepID=UPI00110D69C3|nr:AAA family ATPase [Alteribacter natronophilus]TMW70428.1 ABC transporter ATP-binding protein [Alteribacter natronophilus]
MKINQVNYSYAKSNRQVLNGLSFHLKPDRLNVVAGLNGAGKTTLFDILTGVLKAEGEIEGLPKQNDVVYQQQGVYFTQTLKGRDLVRLVLHCDHSGKTRVRKKEPFVTPCMTNEEKEKMAELWQRPFGQMSVGERRWLLTFVMCRLDRKLYVFDEPTSGVDPHSRVQIMNRIRKLVEEPGKTVVASTHTLHELQFYAVHLVLLHQGKAVFTGTYEDFLTEGGSDNPDTAFQNLVISERPAVSGT